MRLVDHDSNIEGNDHLGDAPTWTHHAEISISPQAQPWDRCGICRREGSRNRESGAIDELIRSYNNANHENRTPKSTERAKPGRSQQLTTGGSGRGAGDRGRHAPWARGKGLQEEITAYPATASLLSAPRNLRATEGVRPTAGWHRAGPGPRPSLGQTGTDPTCRRRAATGSRADAPGPGAPPDPETGDASPRHRITSPPPHLPHEQRSTRDHHRDDGSRPAGLGLAGPEGRGARARRVLGRRCGAGTRGRVAGFGVRRGSRPRSVGS